MTAADDAYQHAKAIIAEAKDSGTRDVSFDVDACRSLFTIPPEIAELNKVINVNLSKTQVTDLTPLAAMTAMRNLTLNHTQVTDLTPLAAMTAMSMLWLNDTLVTDLTPLAAMTAMHRLTLHNTQVADLTPLAAMTAMDTLYLHNTQVADLTPLAAMTAMQRLSFHNTQVADLTPLAAMTAMESLFFPHTQVADLTPLAAMTAMQRLSLHNTQVADLTPLAAMTAMTMLTLTGTQVADLTPLAAMTAMETLHLQYTKVADLTPLAAMTAMVEAKSHGVVFIGTPAAAYGTRLGEISRIKDTALSTMELLAYLNEPTPPPADQSDVPPMNVGDDGVVRSQDLVPNDADDPDQEDMRQEVLRKVRDLIGAIGSSNEWAGLGGTAQHYQKQVDRPLNEFKLSILYSAFNTLRLALEAEESAQAQGRVNDYLPPKIGAALVDLVQTHGLFFMGFPDGADIHAQAMSGLTGEPVNLPPEAGEIVTSLAEQDTVLDAEDQAAMQDDLDAANGDGPSARIGQIRLRARIWNMMGAIGRASWQFGKWSASTIAAADLVAWVLGNQTIISKFLVWAQGPEAIWFQQMLQALKAIL